MLELLVICRVTCRPGHSSSSACGCFRSRDAIINRQLIFCLRQRVRHRRHSAGTASAIGGQLFDPVAGRRRSPGRLFGHAVGGRLSGDWQMAPRTRTV